MMRRMASRLPGVALLAVLLPAMGCGGTSVHRTDHPAPGHAGTAVCAGCHAAAAAAWRRSDHSRSMARATPHSVLAPFESGSTFTAGRETTRFRREGAEYRVQIAAGDGARHDYAVRYTFGFDPLQQYLIEAPRGRYQALGVAWDARPRSAGGQRWFHLQPRHGADRRDVLHWTQPAGTWNFMCAECHSTGVRKGYDAASDAYTTTWSDIDVGCEACHGQGSRHVAWARGAPPDRTADPGMGLVTRLGEGDPVWQVRAGEVTAARGGAASHLEVETCARCHSRRSQLWGAYVAGQSIEQTHRVALVEQGLYFADGQQEDEVFEYGSFTQSRMYAAGVSCRDCHDPHSGELRAAGNALCTRCHAPGAFDAAAHHFHRVGSEASRCVTCHMPARTYMAVDSRRDHAFRVPRPDESVRFGTPNACGTAGCHDNRPAAWAAEAVTRRHGPGAAARPSFTRALAAGRSGQLDGARQLLALAGDRSAPAIARATAVSLLGGFGGPLVGSGVEQAAADADPRVRRAAAALLDLLDETARIRAGAALVADEVRSVRLEAVPVVASFAAALDVNARARLEAAIAEFRASHAFNSDSASAWVNLATLELALGRETDAERALGAALDREPYLVPAVVNLADLLQRRGNEPAAERTLRDAIARTPDQAALHHALGLSLVRQRRRADAVTELARAASLAPEETRYAYVYAVALHDSGDADGARRALEAAQQRRAADRAVLEALLAYAVERGDLEDARRWAEAVVTSAPGDRAAAARVQQLLQQTLTTRP